MNKPKFPKTSLEDYFKYREALFINLSSMMKRGEKARDIRKVLDRVYELYKAYFFLEDFYSFGRLDELNDFLLGSSFFEKQFIDEAIFHEKEHIKMAEDLGYNIKGYSAILLFNYKKNEPSFALQVHIDLDEKLSYENFKKMCMAPKNPSLIDLAFK
ncbi:hypothetical protein J4411_00685 [Candidatus Pacearchaeota archaeon]|nr:hypothetical protein [uncultured archaeon]AQS34677.1 hypothetical protein [uncultured archaeon]MBS3084412.1 hypothetical protein [Candidatus Pacearchaeota archaeon]